MLNRSHEMSKFEKTTNDLYHIEHFKLKPFDRMEYFLYLYFFDEISIKMYSNAKIVQQFNKKNNNSNSKCFNHNINSMFIYMMSYCK